MRGKLFVFTTALFVFTTAFPTCTASERKTVCINNSHPNSENYFFARKIPCFGDCYNQVSNESLTLLHSEQPKLYRVLAVLSAIGLIDLYIEQNLWHRLCLTKPIPSIGNVGQNLFQRVMLDKTYTWYKVIQDNLLIPGMDYVGQNLFLAQVILNKTSYGTQL